MEIKLANGSVLKLEPETLTLCGQKHQAYFIDEEIFTEIANIFNHKEMPNQ